MKKMIRMVLLLFLIVTVTACAATEQEEMFDYDFDSMGANEVNLGGYTCKYLFNPVMNWAVADSSECYLGFTINSPFTDAAIARVNDIETNFNCKIDITYKTVLHDYVKTVLMGGSYVGDVVSGISDMWGDYCRLGLLLGMSEVSEHIDINDEAKWGSKAFVESMFFENDQYGVVPMEWPDLTYTNFGYPMVFNSDIVTSLGQPDPREFIENKEWDWDKFYETIKNYTVKEGDNVKYYGFMGQRRIISEMFIHSNGSTIVNVDSSGNYTYGLYDSRAIKAIDATQELVFGQYKDYIGRAALDYNYDELAEAFSNNECVMSAIYTGYIYGRDAIVGMKVKGFGILPWPHGPDVSDDYTFGIIENIYTGIAIPYNTKSPEATSIIINALYEPLEGFETRDSIRDYMTTYYFFDERDADVFFNMYDNCQYNYFHWFDQAPVRFIDKRQTAAEFVEKNITSMEELFVDGVLPIVKGVEATRGSYNYSLDENMD